MRERLGFTLEQVAVAADIPAPRLREWEISGEIPASAAPYVRGALRRLERDALRAAQARAWANGTEPPSTWAEDGLVARAVSFGDGLRGWRAPAYWGAFCLVCVSVFGVVALLGLSVLNLDFGYALYAAGLVMLMAAGGAAGGLAHHLTAPLRTRGSAGRLAAGVLVAYAALAALLGALALGHAAFAFEWLDPELAARAVSREGLAAWAALGLLAGAALARETR